jgi:hypothetical protein
MFYVLYVLVAMASSVVARQYGGEGRDEVNISYVSQFTVYFG